MSSTPVPATASSRAATALGFGAIGLWGLLALFTAASGTVPPFQLTAMTFAIGGGIGLAVVAMRPGGLALLAQPPKVWLHGVAGLFGYHALYFTALRFAPAAEANLLNYLWPLLIVVFSAFLPGQRLRAHHVVGALLGLAGTALLIGGRAGGIGAGFDTAHLVGYAAAVGCALAWAAYSVSARLLPDVPTEAVAGFCLATAVLALGCHLAVETTVWPSRMGEWLAILALGLGPVGAAFYLWDRGMKRGDIQVLGAASYAAPVLSTLALVAFGYAVATGWLALAVGLIVAGSVVAAKDLLLRR